MDPVAGTLYDKTAGGDFGDNGYWGSTPTLLFRFKKSEIQPEKPQSWHGLKHLQAGDISSVKEPNTPKACHLQRIARATFGSYAFEATLFVTLLETVDCP